MLISKIHLYFLLWPSVKFYMRGCFACTCACVPHVCLVTLGAWKGLGSPGTRVIDGYEPPCDIPECNLAALEEQ